jgi:hypothetical protein
MKSIYKLLFLMLLGTGIALTQTNPSQSTDPSQQPSPQSQTTPDQSQQPPAAGTRRANIQARADKRELASPAR